MAFCDKCASKTTCGPTCRGYAPNGPFYLRGRRGHVNLEFHADMEELEAIETENRRELRKPCNHR